MDGSAGVLKQRAYEFAETGAPMALPNWIEYYAFDAISEMTVRFKHWDPHPPKAI